MRKDIREIAQEVAAVIGLAQNPIISTKFAELQKALNDLVSEKEQLAEANGELKRKLAAKNELTWSPQKRLYFREKDPIPFCPRCKETRNKEVHLLPLNAAEGGVTYACPLCAQRFPAAWSKA